ncbi:MAG: CHAT domain-containing protein [Flavipsychrobacter sp.]|nr:CHAT domain-containing protein [Flavipsychrobacter sp.]
MRLYILVIGIILLPACAGAQSTRVADSILSSYSNHYHELAGNGEWGKALAIGKKALQQVPIEKASSDKRVELWFDIAYMSAELKQFDSAVNYYEKARLELEAAVDRDVEQLGLIFNNLAFAMDNLGRQQKKISYYTKALDLWLTTQPPPEKKLLTALGNLVEAHTEYGSFKQAGHYLEEMKKRSKTFYFDSRKKMDVDQFTGRAETILACIRYYAATDSLLQLKAWVGKMEALFHQSSSAFAAEHSGYLLTALETAGYAFKNRKEFDQSRQYYDKVNRLAKEPFYMMKASANYAILEYDRGANETALAFAKQAISRTDTSWSGSSWYSLMVLEAELQERLGKPDAAIRNIELLLSRLIRKKVERKTISQLSFADLRNLSSYNYIQVLTKAGQVLQRISLSGGGSPTEGRNIFLLAAAMFKEYYQEGVYNKYLDGLNRSIMEGLLSCEIASRPADSMLDSVIQVIENNGSRHIWKKMLHRYTGQLPENQGAVSSDFRLADLRQKLTKNQLLLRYYLTDTALYLVQISKSGIQLNRIEKRAELNMLISDVQRVVTGINADYIPLLKKLSEKLTQPIQNLSKEISQLIIVPDENLGFLAFEPLLLPDNRHLIDKFSVSYAYSLPLWMIHQKPKSGSIKEKGLVAFAPGYPELPVSSRSITTRGTGLYQLPFAQREAREIASLFDGTVFEGKAASRSNFLSAIGSYDYYHFSMHAALDTLSYESTNLVFSENERLHFYELYNLDFPAEMVVLSACNTGIGAMVKGEGLMSLSHALSAGGVRSSVYSLWEVPDKETAEIITGFYKYLEKGYDKATALQQSKLDFLKSNPAKQHPYYWAGFILNGNTDSISKKSGNYLVWILAGMAAMLAAILVYRKLKSV